MSKKVKLIFLGIFAGFCNGLFGSGGGMIVVPCLEKYASLDASKAHSTAIAVILPLTVVSIIMYSRFTDASGSVLIFVCLGGVLGSITGAKLLKRFSSVLLRRIFALLILIASVRMVLL